MRSIVFGKRVPGYSNIIYRESTAVRNIFDIDIFSRLNFVANLSRQSGKRRVIRVKFKVSRHLRGKGDYSSSKKLRLDENKLFQLIFFLGFIEPIVKRSSRYVLCVSRNKERDKLGYRMEMEITFLYFYSLITRLRIS